MTDKEQAELALVQRAVDQLGEHFESVQIFVTRHNEFEQGGTVNIAIGGGNYFARYGQVIEWVMKEDTRTRKKINEET